MDCVARGRGNRDGDGNGDGGDVGGVAMMVVEEEEGTGKRQCLVKHEELMGAVLAHDVYSSLKEGLSVSKGTITTWELKRRRKKESGSK
ncbi:hypothetical protein HZH68_003639 [Vespula germanica]|uniref:Uncharacterized protein n=1 Tax=Vespula germanica TaxID=30212 RepID=A0A834NPI4_VESGE|nr:hypothetical protein HZH68_003639 [Vespula germanica]